MSLCGTRQQSAVVDATERKKPQTRRVSLVSVSVLLISFVYSPPPTLSDIKV